MGYYITGPDFGKVEYLIKEHDAFVFEGENAPDYDELGEDQALICVVENPGFEAAAFAFNKIEFERFIAPDYHGPQRKRTWLIMDRSKAEELTGFKP